MANMDYSKRLSNIQNRKFDRELNETATTRTFSTTDLPENVKYLVESMKPLDQKYNDRTITAANRVQKHLQDNFNLHFNRAYRTQGSVSTQTNIKVHSDFDLLTIIDRYHYTEGTPTSPYTDSDPNQDIVELRSQATKILKEKYDEVEDTKEKSISVFNKSLNRKVDIVFCFWYHSDKYIETKNEHYLGIYLFNFPDKKKERDYPFATVNNVNYKGVSTNDGSRKGIRLLKNLKADSEVEIGLSSFHLTSLVHSINNEFVNYQLGSEILIAKSISEQIKKMLGSDEYRKSVESPNGIERPFASDQTKEELIKLKTDLDQLILDTEKEVLYPSVIRSLLNY